MIPEAHCLPEIHMGEAGPGIESETLPLPCKDKELP